ncbi:MAG: (2Fe-2S)-binding protein [Pseudonocardia sp.]|nr:(2Fe-2S)-binding protein [Pseudonocardia sp.]
MGCCHYFKIAGDGRACSTCPRVGDAERVHRYSELEG